MGKYTKLKQKVLSGTADTNIEFKGLCMLLHRMGFDERISGGHHIFTRENIPEIINLQPDGGKAKRYQVKQIRNILVKYQLGEASVD